MIDVAKLLIDVAKLLTDVATLLINVGKLLTDVGKLLTDVDVDRELMPKVVLEEALVRRARLAMTCTNVSLIYTAARTREASLQVRAMF